MPHDKDLSAQFEFVLAKIRMAEQLAGRSQGSVKLVAVSKGQPSEKVQQYIDFANSRGAVAVIGENYVQEWAAKRASLSGNFEAHLIGPLQSNKINKAVEIFDLIQSVSSLKIAGGINRAWQQRASSAGPKKIFLQVNISSDGAKSGFGPDKVAAALSEITNNMPAIKVAGLMTITKLYENPADAAPDFRALKALAESVVAKFGISLELSMGMSADYQLAIAAGATLVRVGTALFGERSLR